MPEIKPGAEPILPVHAGGRRRRRSGGEGHRAARTKEPRPPGRDPAGRKSLELVTANLNSLATMRFWVEDLQADFSLLQETRVPPAGLAAAVCDSESAVTMSGPPESPWQASTPPRDTPACTASAVCVGVLLTAVSRVWIEIWLLN